MKTYKVYTKWIGYSEIGVEAKSPEEAEEKVWEGDYYELNNGNPTNIQDEQIESVIEQPDEIVDKLKKGL